MIQRLSIIPCIVLVNYIFPTEFPYFLSFQMYWNKCLHGILIISLLSTGHTMMSHYSQYYFTMLSLILFLVSVTVFLSIVLFFQRTSFLVSVSLYICFLLLYFLLLCILSSFLFGFNSLSLICYSYSYFY